MEVARKKRGPYRKYLRDLSCPVPKTSRWRSKKQKLLGASQNAISPHDECSSCDVTSATSQCQSCDVSAGEEYCAVSSGTTDEEYGGMDEGSVSTNDGFDYDNWECDESDSNDGASDTCEVDESGFARIIDSGSDVVGVIDCGSDVDGCSVDDCAEDGDDGCDGSSDEGDSDESCSEDGEGVCSNDDNDDDLQFDSTMFEPIYDNASITLCGAFCAIMEFKRSSRLSFSCIDKLLELLQLFCPTSNSLPRSSYMIKKFFKKFSSVCKKRSFCSDCEEELTGTRCCNASCKKLQASTFMSFDCIKTIKRIMERNQSDLIVTRTSARNVLCDLHTQEHSENPGIIFNTDGVSPFKSSRITVWPIIISFSNLPPNVRMNKENLVIVSLWVGLFKPKMNILFQPLLDLFHKLSTQGIVVETPFGENVFKFSPILGIFDLVAKAPILNMHQFNGVNGCPTCLHPGTWISSRYYLPGTQYSLRTNDSINKDAESAEGSNAVVDGIKGKSVLANIVDLVKSIPIDYMHCVLEGVTKWLVNKWFSTSFHKFPFYIGRNVNKVDAQLVQQCPPHDFTRAPRGLAKYRSYWKASEFRYWLLFYSVPILVEFLPPLYLHHYCLLVCAMHILLQSKIKEPQVRAAEQMLEDFYSMLPELYGKTSCTLNAHSLTHLCIYVRLWGPLWTHSLFGFESYNGHLTSMIHSKYRVAEQLAFSVDVDQTMGCLADRLIEVETERTLTFLGSLSTLGNVRTNMNLIQPGIYSIGILSHGNFSRNEASAIRKITKQATTSIRTFKKLYFYDTIFYAHQNEERKRNSSNCCYVLDGNKHYGVIQKFCFFPPLVLIKPYNKTPSSVLKAAGNPGRNRLKQYAQLDLFSNFCVQVSNLLPVCAIPISALSCKCVHVVCPNSPHSYMIHVPNNFEHH